MLIHDEKISAIVSYATEQRLKCLIERIHSAAHHRETISNLVVQEKNDEGDDDELKSTNTRKRKSNEDTWQQLKRLVCFSKESFVQKEKQIKLIFLEAD